VSERARSRPAPPRREEKKAESRRRILEAARAVFFRDGFMPANLDEVAELADVAKGTLYRYFESKAALYVAVLAHDGSLFERKLRETLAPALSAPDQIRRSGRFYLEHWLRNRDYFRIFWAVENQEVIGELPGEVVEEVTKLWERCLQLLADIVARGVETGRFRACDPWQVAHLLWTLANGMIQTEASAARRKLRRGELGREFEAAIEIVLRGLAAGGPALDGESGLRNPSGRGGEDERNG
jgi:TetR/AcrR family fatty acid metabolism transcriptional regulator